MTAPQGPAVAALPTPSLRRRLACFLYEGVLLFGVLMVAGVLYGVATQQRHALVGTHGLQAFVFMVLGGYFVFFWTRSGQTLAMQTWQIRLVTLTGQNVPRLRAVCRYVLAWLWFLPALAALYVSGLTGTTITFMAIIAGVLTYAALAWLHPQRQFWHDAVCGTRLIRWQLPLPRA